MHRGQLADPQRDQDAWSPYGQGTGKCTEDRTFLEKQEYVTRVLYPGLESHPGYELMKKQARGFGSILTFEVDSKEKHITFWKM